MSDCSTKSQMWTSVEIRTVCFTWDEGDTSSQSTPSGSETDSSDVKPRKEQNEEGSGAPTKHWARVKESHRGGVERFL